MTGSCGASQKRVSLKLRRKEIFSDCDETKSKEEKWEKERDKNECMSQAERTIQVIVEARQYRDGSERGSRFMLSPQRSHCHNKTNSGVVDSSEVVEWKGRNPSTTDWYRAKILDGHRDWQIRRLRLVRHSHSGCWIYPKRGENGSSVRESAGGKKRQ